MLGRTLVISIFLALVVAIAASGATSAYTLDGTYELNGGTDTESGRTYMSSTTDTSAIYVHNGGVLTLIDPTITTSGGTSSLDDSSFYGLNAGVLATAGSSITIIGGTISTTGSGANGVFATGTGATITLTNVTITATGQGGHGVDATLGGTLVLTNVTITTSGANGAAIATDRGSGTIIVTGGTVLTSGADSPGVYSTGEITITGATITATGAEAAVIEGVNSITLTDTNLSSAKKRGVMIYQSMSGDADEGTGTFTMTGGSLTAEVGPAFYVTNTNAIICLSGGAEIEATSGILISAAAGNWGTSGSNGGAVTFVANGETLFGDLITDDISSIDATLENGTTLSGAIDEASLTLDETSVWNVTGDSVLTYLSDEACISGTTITNIYGNSYMVYYDSTLSENSYLDGKTYTLMNGGTLTPVGGSDDTNDADDGGSDNATEETTGSEGGSTDYAPYIITVAAMVLVIAVTAMIVMKRRKR